MNDKIKKRSNTAKQISSEDNGTAILVTKLLKVGGQNPYVYIYGALKLIMEKDYTASLRMLEFAYMLQGIFYHPGSVKDNDFRQIIIFIKYLIKNNPERIREIIVHRKGYPDIPECGVYNK